MISQQLEKIKPNKEVSQLFPDSNCKYTEPIGGGESAGKDKDNSIRKIESSEIIPAKLVEQKIAAAFAVGQDKSTDS